MTINVKREQVMFSYSFQCKPKTTNKLIALYENYEILVNVSLEYKIKFKSSKIFLEKLTLFFINLVKCTIYGSVVTYFVN